MADPTNLQKKQAAQLFPDSDAEQSAFLESLLNPEKTRQPAVIWTQPEYKNQLDFAVLSPGMVPGWLPEEVNFLAPDETPGKSELFAKGAIYPVDTSSIYTASALLTVERAKRVLDVCAAPGGKSLFGSSGIETGFYAFQRGDWQETRCALPQS